METLAAFSGGLIRGWVSIPDLFFLWRTLRSVSIRFWMRVFFVEPLRLKDRGHRMPAKKIHPRFHLFYGWYILASSFTILFFNSGARYSFGVMFKPMIAEFGWSRGSISLAYSSTRSESSCLPHGASSHHRNRDAYP